MKLPTPSCLSDETLTASLKRVAHAEREATVELINLLLEFDKRRLYLGAGFSSLFAAPRSFGSPSTRPTIE
jgi:hypothetical protein